jgi:NAD(P)-dependent dehydrogenase (short-subunit alcohol dehydrogenase family)
MEEAMLEGKVAVVTGAGRGIGRAIAAMMARHGARVVVNDIGTGLDGTGSDATPAQEAVDEIRAAGGEAVANFDSVADFASARRIVQCATDRFGRLDCVVNNAGILRDRAFHKMEEQEWDASIGVMLKGAFNVSRHAAEIFRRQESGSFVHMTSNAGLIGNAGQANYAAAKLGIVGLSKSIAIDMARFNVRSNCIAPVAFTRMQGSIPIKDEATARRVASRREVTPDLNAPLAVYLASDAAAGVNAQVFSVRKNEIFLMSQPRPLRGLHRAEGWTPKACADHLYPALKGMFYPPLERSAEVFPYDPI